LALNGVALYTRFSRLGARWNDAASISNKRQEQRTSLLLTTYYFLKSSTLITTDEDRRPMTIECSKAFNKISIQISDFRFQISDFRYSDYQRSAFSAFSHRGNGQPPAIASRERKRTPSAPESVNLESPLRLLFALRFITAHAP